MVVKDEGEDRLQRVDLAGESVFARLCEGVLEGGDERFGLLGGRIEPLPGASGKRQQESEEEATGWADARREGRPMHFQFDGS